MNAINRYRLKRIKRLEERYGEFHGSKRLDAGNGDSHGNTRIPFGLCKREGIEISPDWTPEDAWNALEDKGYSANKAYKELKETGKVSNNKREEKSKANLEQAFKTVSQYKKVAKTAEKLKVEFDKVLKEQSNAFLWMQRFEDAVKDDEKSLNEYLKEYGPLESLSKNQKELHYDRYLGLLNYHKEEAKVWKKEFEEKEERRKEIANQLQSYWDGKENYKKAVDALLSEHPYAKRVQEYRGVEEKSRYERRRLHEIDDKINSEKEMQQIVKERYDKALKAGDSKAIEEWGKRLKSCNRTLQKYEKMRGQITSAVSKYDEEMNGARGDASDREWKTIYDLALERDTVQEGSYESTRLNDFANTFKGRNVQYFGPRKYVNIPSEESIIRDVGGKDQTDGSCASLVFAYLANKLGFAVTDFRGGESQNIFAECYRVFVNCFGGNVEQSDLGIKTANEMLEKVEEGKEYAFSTGQHAAIVRRANGKLQYLELQSSEKDNGWYELTDVVLKNRFKCPEVAISGWSDVKVRTSLLGLDKLTDNHDFIQIMGYINTDYNEQKKGDGGGKK